jgi:transposase
MEVFNAEDEKGVFSRVQREAVALLEGSGRPLMQVATEVGISPSMLRNWRAAVHGGTARSRAATRSVSSLPSLADQASEITRLKRELDRTRMERDVLKRALGIFAEVPR